MKHISAILLALFIASTLAACGAQEQIAKESNTQQNISMPGTTMDESTASTVAEPETDATEQSAFAGSPYRIILEAYQNGIRTKYTPTEEYPEGGYVGSIVLGREITNLYYALIDLCNDGQPELFIAGNDGDEVNPDNMRIYDAWGCSEGKPARLFSDNLGWRGCFTIHADGTILYDSQSISGEYALYTVEEDGALVSGKGVSMDMGKEYYSHEYWAFNELSETTTISQAEYEAFYDEMDAYEPMTDIQWIAFTQE